MIHAKAGDWKKCGQKVKEAVAIADSMDEILKSAFELNVKLKSTIEEAYALAPFVDEHFANSLLSTTRQTFYMKAYLLKLGLEDFKDILTPPHLIKSFGTEIKQSCDWLMKLKNYTPPVLNDDKKTNQLSK